MVENVIFYDIIIFSSYAVYIICERGCSFMASRLGKLSLRALIALAVNSFCFYYLQSHDGLFASENAPYIAMLVLTVLNIFVVYIK